MFGSLPVPPADALHAVMDRFRADQRTGKIDLGVGVFRDASGLSPVMRSVRQAEMRLAAQRETKAYLPLAGPWDFVAALSHLILRSTCDGRVAALLATGGTGAIRLALELARTSSARANVHLGTPSWPNHETIVNAVGLPLKTHRYFRPGQPRPDVDRILEAARDATRGDLFILHGPCHNPTGLDLLPAERSELLAVLRERGVVPLIDAAYYGLADGLEADLDAIRRDLTGFERAFLTISCSKSFGLYRDRVGLCLVLCANESERRKVQGTAERISRSLVSMAPAHGAEVVATILRDPELEREWRSELEDMRLRIHDLRSILQTLSGRAKELSGASAGNGIFMLLDLEPGAPEKLAATHAIHMPATGRINITGLKLGDAERLADALTKT